MIEYREYKENDENAILQLYSEVFNKKLSIVEWRWKYNGFNSKQKIIFLAFDQGKCIAQYALMPYEINALGGQLDSFVSLDSMVHPDYQGLGIFSKLVRFSMQNIKKNKFPFITFLNEKSISLYTNKFGWKYLGDVPVYFRFLSLNHIKRENKLLFIVLRPFSLLINFLFTNYSQISLVEFYKFKNELDLIQFDSNYFSMSNNRDFLIWRYDDSPKKYIKYKIIFKQNIIGYCVLKKEVKFGLKFIWIIDIQITKFHIRSFSKILNCISMKYLNTADFVSSLLPSQKFKGYFNKAGYFKIPTIIFPHKFYFCIKLNKYREKSILKKKSWYMTWSLNDVL